MHCISYLRLPFYIRIDSESFFKFNNSIAPSFTSLSSYNRKRKDFAQTRTLLDIQFALMTSGAFGARIVKPMTTIAAE
jgi:hypothetical protein